MGRASSLPLLKDTTPPLAWEDLTTRPLPVAPVQVAKYLGPAPEGPILRAEIQAEQVASILLRLVEDKGSCTGWRKRGTAAGWV